MRYIIFYIAAVNAFSFVLFGIDKYLARNGMRRVSERALFVSALLGGSFGALLGMWTFRHKTQHKSFRVFIPLILLLQIAAGGALFWYFFVLPKG